MTIEKIDYTSERIEEEENKKELEEKKERNLKLIELFNKKAKEMNSNYRIFISGKYPHLFLIKKLLIFKNQEELNQIYYSKDEDEFSFIDGLDEYTFKTIEPILNNIDIKFNIKLKSGEIPIKYKILENLE